MDTRFVDGVAEDILNILPLSECFFFGASTGNQRIENWWLRIRSSQLEWWITFFHYLQNNGFYVSGQNANQVVLLFVFMPILRREITGFV
jgi:hypothetical protein